MLIKSQSEVRLHTGRSVHTSTPANLPDPPFRFFEGLVPRLLIWGHYWLIHFKIVENVYKTESLN